jgi:hypothetical protein
MRRLGLLLLLVLVLVPGAASAGTRQQPEAVDGCGTDEITDADLTAPDAPWADLCAAWVSAEVVPGGSALQAISVTTQVAGNLVDRTHTSRWAVSLAQGDCVHSFFVADDSATGDQLRVEQITRCGHHPGACPEPLPTVMQILRDAGIGASCSAEGTWDVDQRVTIPQSAVGLSSDTITLRVPRDQLTAGARARLVPGALIKSVAAVSSSGTVVHSGQSAQNVTADFDVADSTGRTYTIGE